MGIVNGRPPAGQPAYGHVLPAAMLATHQVLSPCVPVSPTGRRPASESFLSGLPRRCCGGPGGGEGGPGYLAKPLVAGCIELLVLPGPAAPLMDLSP